MGGLSDPLAVRFEEAEGPAAAVAENEPSAKESRKQQQTRQKSVVEKVRKKPDEFECIFIGGGPTTIDDLMCPEEEKPRFVVS